MTTVTQRMNASREARKRQNMMATRAYSPLSPVIQRVYGGKEEGNTFLFPLRPHRSAPRVKFSSKVTEFPDHNPEADRREDSGQRQSSKIHGHHSPSHSSSVHAAHPSGHSPSHAPVPGHAGMGTRTSEHGNMGARSSEHGITGMRSSEQGLRMLGHGMKGGRTSDYGGGSDRSMPDGDSGYSKHPPAENVHTHSRKPSEK